MWNLRFLRLMFAIALVLQASSCASTRQTNSFEKENATYVISSKIDLHGSVLEIPKKCILDFRGGSFVNGQIICNETTLKGKPQVENISGTVKNADFHSSWVTSHDKWSILCGIKANKIILDEDVTLREHHANDFKSSILDGTGHVIKIDYDLFELKALIRCFDNVRSIKNIHFDFGNHEFHSIALWFPHRTETLDISNVSFSNLNNATVVNYGFEGLVISAMEVPGYSIRKDFSTSVSKVSAFNMKALTDNSGKDGESTMSIVCLNCDVPSRVNSTLSVNVSDCDFKEIVVYNKEGKVVANDAACIYVHQEVSSTNSYVHISNITGYNFGRRLVKTDGGNLFIENINGESYNGGSLCMVGCNNGDVPHSANRAFINGLTFRGRIGYVVACMVDNTVIKNIDAELTDYISPRVLSGVVFVGDDATCRVENVNIKGKSFLFSSTSQTQVAINGVKLISDDAIDGIHYLLNTIDIKSLELSDFNFEIKGSLPTITTYQNANPNISRINSNIILRNGTINVLNDNGGTVINDYSTNHLYSLSIENVIINVKHGTAPIVNISSPTLKRFDVKNIDVTFKKFKDSAKVLNLVCNRTSEYSLSGISCENNLESSPVSISGEKGSKVCLENISVKGPISSNKSIQIIKNKYVRESN